MTRYYLENPWGLWNGQCFNLAMKFYNKVGAALENDKALTFYGDKMAWQSILCQYFEYYNRTTYYRSRVIHGLSITNNIQKMPTRIHCVPNKISVYLVR